MQPISIQVILDDLISAAVELISEQVAAATETVAAFGSDATAAFDAVAEATGSLRDVVAVASEDIQAGLMLVAETTQVVADTVAGLQGAFTTAFGDIVPAVQAMTATMQELQASMLTLTDALTGTAGALGVLGSDLYANTIATQDNTIAVVANGQALGENATAATAAAAASVRGQTETGNLSTQFTALKGPVLLASAALLGIAASAVVVGSRYESAMAVVQGLTGQTAETMAKLDTQVLAMASDMGVAPTKIADGLYYLLSAGIDTTHVMGVMKTVLEGSSAAMVDQAKYANVLTTYMQAFGASQDQATTYSDKLIQIVVYGKTTFAALAGSFGQAATAAKATGVTADELGGALDVLTLHGWSAQRAEQNLGTTMMDLGLKTDSLAKHAKKLHVTFDQTKFEAMSFEEKLNYLWIAAGKNQHVFESLFSNMTEGKVSFALLANNGNDLRTSIQRLSDATKDGGATLKAYNVYQQTTGYLWNQVKATTQVALIDMYRALQPMINGLLKELLPALQHFGEWVSTHGPEVQQVFKSLLLVVGSLATAFVLLGPAAKMVEHLGVIGRIGGRSLADAFTPLSGVFERLVTGGTRLGGALGNVTGWFPAMVGHIGRFTTSATGMLNSVPGLIEVGFGHAARAVGALGNVMDFVGSQALTNFLGSLLRGSTWVNLLRGGFVALTSGASGLLPALGAVGGGILAALGPILLIVGAIAIVVVLFLKFRTEVMSVAMTLFAALKPSIDTIKTAFLSFIGGIEKAWDQAWPKIKPAMEQLLAALKNLKPAVEVVGGIIAKVFQVVFAVLGAVVGAFIKAFPAIISFFTGIVTVVGQVGALIQAVFSGQWGKIPGIIGNIVGGIWRAITSGLGAVKDFVFGFIGNIIGFFTHLWDTLVGHSIVPDMIFGIIKFFLMLPAKILGMLAGFVGGIIGHFGDMLKNGLKLAGGLATGVASHFAQMGAAAITHVAHMNIPVVSGIAQMASNSIKHTQAMWSTVTSLFTAGARKAADEAAIQRDKVEMHALAQKTAVIDHTIQQHVGVVAALTAQRLGVIEQLKNCKDEATRQALQQKLGVIDQHLAMERGAVASAERQRNQVAAKMAALKADAIKHTQDMHTGVLGALDDLPNKLSDLGHNMMTSLGNAVMGAKDALVHSLQNVGSSMLDGFKSIFNIKSPSRVMHEMGTMLTQGLINGFQSLDPTQAFVKHVNGIGSPVALAGAIGGVRRLGAAAGAPSGGGGVGEQHVHIHLEGGIGDGWRMLNGTQRTQIAQLLASEFAKQANMQRNMGNGYTGV